MSVIEIKVPPLGESVTEATVAKWLRQNGDTVQMDDALVELETDKVTLEVNAPNAGVLSDIKFKEGDTVVVGDVLALIQTDASQSKGKSAPQESKPAAKPAEEVQKKPTPQTEKEKLSPAVRKMVEEKGIQPEEIQGSGRDGRLLKGDLLSFADRQQVAQPRVTIEVPTYEEEGAVREERVKMTRLRKTIATRLKEAQNTAAMLTTFNEIDMSHVMEARTKYKDAFEKKHGIKLGFMSFFVKAAVVALKEIPAVNAEIDGDDLIYKNHYDIGVAVSTPQGLVVPVVRNADRLGFAQVEQAIAELSKKGRDGTLSMQELTGGTFTITNGGIFGSLMSTPILNPPQSGILGMHKIQERPVVVKGQIEVRPMMYVALTYDHRIIDGREAVTFLVRIKECVEDPERILLTV